MTLTRWFRLLSLLGVGAVLCSAQWVNLITQKGVPNGKDIQGWEVIGDGYWSIWKDGTVVGQRGEASKAKGQSWLYTKKEYGEFDLQLQYWNRYYGNSGLSIRDVARAKEYDIPSGSRPSAIGYEIQINAHDVKFPTGSVYHFVPAKGGKENEFDWNSLEIQSRNSGITVLLNGVKVSFFEGDPKRSLTGPIGLQLHDGTAMAMWRNIRIRELKKR